LPKNLQTSLPSIEQRERELRAAEKTEIWGLHKTIADLLQQPRQSLRMRPALDASPLNISLLARTANLNISPLLGSQFSSQNTMDWIDI